MRKLFGFLLLLICIGLLIWRFFPESFETETAEKDLPYPERVKLVADQIMAPLTDAGVDRAGELRSLFEEGKTRYQNGIMTREQALKTRQVIETLISLNVQRQGMQDELNRLKKLPFSRVGEGGEAEPESKRQHFLTNQPRLWQQQVTEVRPILDRQLADIR